MVKLEFLFKFALFEQILAHSLFGAWAFLLVHIRFTPSERTQKLCELIKKKNRPWKLDHHIGPWKEAIFHGPTPRSMV